MSRQARKTSGWQVPPPAEPVTEEYLASVTIGERTPHGDRIRLVAYDPNWPSLFALAADKVGAALGEKALLIEHVGSTAVPGLSAKPIIDMVLAVEDSADEGSYVPLLEAERFVLRVREPDWFEHRFLVLKSGDQIWQLHVFSAGCEEVERMLAFRDWLGAHDAERRLYESVKMALAGRTWRHVQNYADAKSEIVRQILKRAGGGKADGV
ncbi:MAG TPA: GrpB family protein [Tepidisphaeraceae bacterium]|nr:GrpB family protein [Tepidisphaeraceae bacterium]